ncbi:MAG: hypothetical protein KGJ02_01060 [Verrucomicrobiota bacterium]|nr:hypothetical protein [Verrucomicrobiota bacterium]
MCGVSDIEKQVVDPQMQAQFIQTDLSNEKAFQFFLQDAVYVDRKAKDRINGFVQVHPRV